MQNPDEAIEQYQLAKKDRERLERMRHIGCHMPGLLTCDDGTRWHPSEILPLVDEVERLRKVVEFQKAAWAGDLAELDALQADRERLREVMQIFADLYFKEAINALAATPEQSLARLRNEVLEKAAKVCDRFAEREMHPAECAGALRAMKEPE